MIGRGRTEGERISTPPSSTMIAPGSDLLVVRERPIDFRS
jgi:hypothetical protein